MEQIEKPTGLWLGELIHFYDEMVISKELLSRKRKLVPFSREDAF